MNELKWFLNQAALKIKFLIILNLIKILLYHSLHLAPFQIHGLLLFIIVIYITIIYIYKEIYHWNLLSPFNVACMYIFLGFNCLWLDNCSECSSLGNTKSPSISAFELPITLLLGLGPYAISPIYIDLPTCVVFV